MASEEMKSSMNTTLRSCAAAASGSSDSATTASDVILIGSLLGWISCYSGSMPCRRRPADHRSIEFFR